MKAKEQTKQTRNSSQLPKYNSSSQFILPRQGWQNKQAFLKAIIKAKRTLDIAEVSNFLD